VTRYHDAAAAEAAQAEFEQIFSRGEKPSEMPDLPASKAQILSQAQILETRSFRRSLVQSLKTHCLISGSVGASFTVQRDPEPTILRKQK